MSCPFTKEKCKTECPLYISLKKDNKVITEGCSIKYFGLEKAEKIAKRETTELGGILFD